MVLGGYQMRISKKYRLGLTQPSLDFVDVDTKNDTKVFLSPTAISSLPSDWGDTSVSLIQNFFRHVLDQIKQGRHENAEALLLVLREPNETHLGLSRGRSQGRALGKGSAKELWKALSKSKAAQSGLLVDLEDAALMIEGISVDIISDITTNIIRGPLIEYTQRMCEQHGIPTVNGVESGPVWNAQTTQWTNEFARLPVTENGKLLLVPKAIVRQRPDYDAGEYYRNFLLTHMQQVELDSGSSLVELLKNGRRRVTKKILLEKFGSDKAAIVRETLKYPEALKKYKDSKEAKKSRPLSLEKITELANESPPDWDRLLFNVTSLAPGKDNADRYEKAIEALLTALLYPALTNPISQHRIHDDRKRIDITFTNMATGGFFSWLATHYPSSQIMVECKNYTRDLKNPELDQLSSRFSRSRGRVGLIVCRGFDKKELFEERCRDTAKDDRGFVIVIDDDDLSALVTWRRDNQLYESFPLLRAKFQKLID
jgi:hypothetical protein